MWHDTNCKTDAQDAPKLEFGRSELPISHFGGREDKIYVSMNIMLYTSSWRQSAFFSNRPWACSAFYSSYPSFSYRLSYRRDVLRCKTTWEPKSWAWIDKTLQKISSHCITPCLLESGQVSRSFHVQLGLNVRYRHLFQKKLSSERQSDVDVLYKEPQLTQMPLLNRSMRQPRFSHIFVDWLMQEACTWWFYGWSMEFLLWPASRADFFFLEYVGEAVLLDSDHSIVSVMVCRLLRTSEATNKSSTESQASLF